MKLSLIIIISALVCIGSASTVYGFLPLFPNTLNVDNTVPTGNVIDIYDTTVNDYTQPNTAVVSSPTPTFTDNGKTATTNTLSTGNVHVVKFTGLAVGRQINGLKYDCSSSCTGSIRIKMYADDGGGGAPGTLLAQSNAFPVATGINEVPFSSIGIVPASSNIYVGMEVSTADVFVNTHGASGVEQAVAHVFGVGPNPFGAATAMILEWHIILVTDSGLLSVDSNTNTEWQSSNETHPNVYVDTGSAQILSALAIFPDNTKTTSTQLLIQTSPDTLSWTTKRTVNVSALSNGTWNFIRWDIDSINERYVRIFGNDVSNKTLTIPEIKVLIPSSNTLLFRHGHEFLNPIDPNISISQ